MLNDKEKKLIVYFLEDASEMYDNNICNDVDPKIWRGWTKKERQEFVKEYHKWNGDPEEYDPNHLELPDFAITSFLAEKLKKTYT